MDARFRAVTLIISLALVAAACAGTTGTVDATSPGSSEATGSPPATGGRVERTAGVVVIPCTEPIADVLVDLELVDVDALTDLSSIGEDGELLDGNSGNVEALLGDATMSGIGLCSVKVPGWAQSALDEAERAIAAGDRDEARRILEGLLATDLSAWVPSAPGIFASGVAEEHSHLTMSKLALAAAELSETGGMDLTDAFLDMAARQFALYAMGDDLHPGEIATMEELGDINALVALAAQAALLGRKDVENAALDAARRIAEARLEGLIDDFSPCTATPSQIERLGEATAKAALLGAGGDSTILITNGRQLVQSATDIQLRRRAGIYIPECDVAATISATGTSSVDGIRVELTADLQTCDATTWTGRFEHRIVDPAGSSGAITAISDVTVELPAPSGTATTDIVFVVGGSVVYEEGGQTGTFSYSGTGIGTFTLTVDREAGTAVIDVDGEPMSVRETVTVATGTSTYPFEHPGADGHLEAEVVDVDPCS